ncbi:MAG: helix-turn-helix domain-containing protein [Prevotella sp.]|jgi:AraC-like DNA-binding protein|nr:helix-turn-helix domain-containing protein [Prevotella sp.]
MYIEYQPHPFLSQYIETYWSSTDFAEKEVKRRVLPDGCVDIIFSFHQQSLPHIVGTMTTFLEVEYLGEVRFIGIRFKPGGITAFTRVPVNEFTDSRVELFSTESVFDKSFSEDIAWERSTTDILSFVDNYLLSRIPKLSLLDERVDYAVSLIKQGKGNIPIPLIAEQACLSKRQFERRFLAGIGISPKAFSRIIKFKNTHHLLKSGANQSLFDLAVDCGYYDHAHLIKEFKRLSGSLPSEL